MEKATLCLLTQTEVVEAVTGLTGDFSQPILQDIRASSRAFATPPSSSYMQEEAEGPSDRQVPPVMDYPGWDIVDEHILDMGLDNRRSLRRLEDFLALSFQSPLAVSHYTTITAGGVGPVEAVGGSPT